MKPLLEKVQRQLFLSLSWPHKPPTCTYREDCLSIVIPALNEAACIENTIHLIWERSALYLPSANADRRQSIHQASSSPSTIRYVEVIVVDGGSSDETLLQACRGAPWWHAAHLRVTRLPPLARPARANQMNYGASIAQGAYLMFLHADTVLPWSYPQIVYRTLQQTGHPSGGDSVPNTRTVGAFSLSFPPALPLLRLVAWGANVRAKLLRQPYGDQAYFMRRETFETLGGFAHDWPFLEDVEFTRRARQRFGWRHGIVVAPERLQTSARRYERLGVVRAVLLNQFILVAHFFGIGCNTLATWYRGMLPGGPAPNARPKAAEPSPSRPDPRGHR
ncbi:hypothetical protein CDCA_CDCA03G0999 [Cyanidium caldarium]|uniref:Glycosyltransferase 2-like domain-containing protein n=1 Tax=Cyanidium caldarium TaxID=2771 RepID=A0AAV9IRN8_CYACA|nr:hypothetical protein CDCA_CDCA03G0999 [Cyanidium caldarium]